MQAYQCTLRQPGVPDLELRTTGGGCHFQRILNGMRGPPQGSVTLEPTDGPLTSWSCSHPATVRPACPLRQVTGDSVSASRDPRFLRWVVGAPLQLRGPGPGPPSRPCAGHFVGTPPREASWTAHPLLIHCISEGTPARSGVLP